MYSQLPPDLSESISADDSVNLSLQKIRDSLVPIKGHFAAKTFIPPTTILSASRTIVLMGEILFDRVSSEIRSIAVIHEISLVRSQRCIPQNERRTHCEHGIKDFDLLETSTCDNLSNGGDGRYSSGTGEIMNFRLSPVRGAV
jgi:hypothetical protein